MSGRKYKFIENPSELGAGVRGASLGPISVRLEDNRRGTRWYNKIPFESIGSMNQVLSAETPFKHARYIDSIFEQNDILASKIERELNSGYFPIVLSGDHSNAIGSIAGLKNTFPEGKLGVIWIDAHADLHTPYTTPSGNVHGMPLGASLGEGYQSDAINTPHPETVRWWTRLTHLGSKGIHPKVHPGDLVLIDIRDLEEQEWRDIEDNNIRNYVPARILNMTMTELAEATLKYLDHCDHLYISFDVDSMDPSVSKGTGTSVENGLELDEAKELLKILFAHPKLRLLEITEINPLIDEQNSMARAVLSILDHIL
ncbi:MAG: arginase [Flavobacteriales bacterium]|nr:arginase [Flavobacteriales bacterium]